MWFFFFRKRNSIIYGLQCLLDEVSPRNSEIHVCWLIDCFGFYTVSAIFQSCNGGDYFKINDRLWNFEVSLAALTSLLFNEIQRNCLLCAKGVVILDTGHHLTSHVCWFRVRVVKGHNTMLQFLYNIWSSLNKCE